MATLKFYLTRPHAKERTAIFFRLSYGLFDYNPDGSKKYLPLKYYTDESIHPKYWNNSKGAAKVGIQYTDGIALNFRLKEIEKEVVEALRGFRIKNIQPTHDQLAESLDRVLRPDRKPRSENIRLFIEFAQYIYQTAEKSPNTKKTYHTTIEQVLKPLEARRKRKLSFDDIDLEFYQELREFMNEKGYATKTQGKHIKLIKFFMNEAKERELHTNNKYNSRKFEGVNEESESIYLNETELDKMLALDLSDVARLEKVRDLFIVGAYTGLRFSDLCNLSKSNFTASGTIRIRTKKTNTIIEVPVHPHVDTVFKRYDYALPVLTNQKFNAYIKEVGELAGIDNAEQKSMTKGGIKVTDKHKKFELITAHTARRSFATNAYLDGVNPIDIMKITGHTTVGMLLNYIKIDVEQNAIKLQSNKFFNKEL